MVSLTDFFIPSTSSICSLIFSGSEEGRSALFNTGKISDSELVDIVNKVFDLRPEKIIEHLDLKKPIYRKIAAYGHFGRGDSYKWEITDKKEELSSFL